MKLASEEERVMPEDVSFPAKSATVNTAGKGGCDQKKQGSEAAAEPSVVYVRKLSNMDIALRLLAYALFQYIFWWLGFGAPFFLVACFYFLYATTASRPLRQGEKSAYAHFNEDHERIHGDIDPQTLVRQMGYVPRGARARLLHGARLLAGA